MGSLRQMASKHVTHMDRAPGTPYHRVLSPQERKDLESAVANKVQVLAGLIKDRLNTPPAAADAASQQDTKQKPATPPEFMQQLKVGAWSSACMHDHGPWSATMLHKWLSPRFNTHVLMCHMH